MVDNVEVKNCVQYVHNVHTAPTADGLVGHTGEYIRVASNYWEREIRFVVFCQDETSSGRNVRERDVIVLVGNCGGVLYVIVRARSVVIGNKCAASLRFYRQQDGDAADIPPN